MHACVHISTWSWPAHLCKLLHRRYMCKWVNPISQFYLHVELWSAKKCWRAHIPGHLVPPGWCRLRAKEILETSLSLQSSLSLSKYAYVCLYQCLRRKYTCEHIPLRFNRFSNSSLLFAIWYSIVEKIQKRLSTNFNLFETNRSTSQYRTISRRHAGNDTPWTQTHSLNSARAQLPVCESTYSHFRVMVSIVHLHHVVHQPGVASGAITQHLHALKCIDVLLGYFFDGLHTFTTLGKVPTWRNRNIFHSLEMQIKIHEHEIMWILNENNGNHSQSYTHNRSLTQSFDLIHCTPYTKTQFHSRKWIRFVTLPRLSTLCSCSIASILVAYMMHSMGCILSHAISHYVGTKLFVINVTNGCENFIRTPGVPQMAVVISTDGCGKMPQAVVIQFHKRLWCDKPHYTL